MPSAISIQVVPALAILAGIQPAAPISEIACPKPGQAIIVDSISSPELFAGLQAETITIEVVPLSALAIAAASRDPSVVSAIQQITDLKDSLGDIEIDLVQIYETELSSL